MGFFPAGEGRDCMAFIPGNITSRRSRDLAFWQRQFWAFIGKEKETERFRVRSPFRSDITSLT